MPRTSKAPPPPSARGKCYYCGVDARGKLGRPVWFERAEEDPNYDLYTSRKDWMIKRRLCHECYAEHVTEDGIQ